MRTKVFVALVTAVSLLIVGLLWMVDRSVEAERVATARQAEFKQLGLDLARASDFLTEEARRYTIFGDKKHLANYWREVNETKTRDRVVQRLTELGAPRAELDLIEKAKRQSDALVTTEEAAMKAVEAGDLDQARQLMFGPDYDRNKQTIAEPMNEFQRIMNERADKEAREARDSAGAMMLVAEIVIGLMAAGIAAILFFFFAQRVVTPVAELSKSVERLAKRDYKAEIPETHRNDEIGALAKAVLVFKESMIEGDRLAAEQRKEQETKERRAKAMAEAVAEFETAIGAVVKTVSSAATEMQAAAQAMTATAEETTRQATAVAAASEQASSNVQTVATAGEELSSSIAEIGRQVNQSAEIAAKAVTEAGQTDQKVQGLADSAQKIGEVVTLIQDIAAQTNLLALNATIEAARAGEAGKGFAVVASEVKSLATQTAKATEEIAGQIGAIQGATKQSVEAIKGIGHTITQINEISTTIASAVEEQGAATQEIARNVQQAAKGTEEVSENISGVTKAAGETGAAATQVLGAAGELAKQAETLREQVDAFLSKVRAA